MLNKNLILVTLLLFMSIGCTGTEMPNKMVLKCSVFPTGVTSKTYLLKVYEDGSLNVIFGDNGQDIEDDSFEKVISDRTISLKEVDFKIINDLKTKVLTLEEIKKTHTKKGGWEVILIINDKKYHFYYGELKDTPIIELIEVLKRISPIKINIHSWS